MSRTDFDLTKIKAFAFDVDGVLSSDSIITGGRTEAVRKRFEGLGLSHVYLGAAVKIKVFEQWIAECGLQADEVMYMGDDIPDYEVMLVVGLPACPADAAPEIKQIARYISPFCGGMGCGRDIIEQVLRAQGKWMADQKAFGW